MHGSSSTIGYSLAGKAVPGLNSPFRPGLPRSRPAAHFEVEQVNDQIETRDHDIRIGFSFLMHFSSHSR
jgi:hypothetical protein